MKPQAIFIDIDNTLIPHTRKLFPNGNDDHFTASLENTLALKNAQKKGIYIILATGRSYDDAAIVINKFRVNKYGDYVISNNAASINKLGDQPEELFEHEIDLASANKIIEYGQKHNLLIKMSQDPKYYGHTPFKLLNYIFKKHGHEIVDYWHLDASLYGLRRKLGYVPVTLSKNKVKKIAEDAKKQFPNQSVVVSGPGRFIEINEKGISKSSGIEFLAKKLNLDLKQCVAIGDSNNDIPMFKAVGISIALTNAQPHVKKHAKFQAAHVRKSGVAEAINSVYEMKQKDEY